MTRELVLNGEPLATRPLEDEVHAADGTRLDVRSQILDRREVRLAYSPGLPEHPVGPLRVPDDRYLLLGDHRNRANDGRFWGTVHRSDLIGPVTSIYFSADPGTSAIRWDRVGATVE